jgi:outer membrane protein OmpA-like peptidoglycan-associated protein
MAPMPHDGKAAEAQITLIRPVVGLVITSTVHSSFGSVEDTAVHTYGVLDTENWYSVTAVSPQEIRYGIRLAAPSDAQADSDARKFKIGRRVRRQDIEQSARMTLFYSTADPDMYAGQTFAETSVKTLGLLKSGSDVPFVLGVVSSEDMFGPDNSLTTAAQGMVAGGKSNGPLSPAHLAGAFAMFSSDRRYYRGPLHRVEPAAVVVPILVNGLRTNLPAIHAAGTFSFGTQPPVQAEFWWLDSPLYPLTLKWKFDKSAFQVTRIDVPPDGGGSGNSADSRAAGPSALAMRLNSKACRAELSGVYFNTGSAVLLEESWPTLEAVSGVIKQSTEGLLTIEGHTDNVGTAQYNQDLSERRAAAVRDALVSKYGVPGARLTAKGYGLTRPVETNSTIEGRAHNRRVELSRACANGGAS